MVESVADLKPRGIKSPLNLVPMILLEMYDATSDSETGLSDVPSNLLHACAAAFHDGSVKYEPWNWVHQADLADMRHTYTGALLRHIHLLVDGESHATDSGASHIGHAAACAAILAHNLDYTYEHGCVSWDEMTPSGALMDELVRAAHSYADRSRGSDLDDVAELARVVRCLGDLAYTLNHGYTEPTSARHQRATLREAEHTSAVLRWLDDERPPYPLWLYRTSPIDPWLPDPGLAADVAAFHAADRCTLEPSGEYVMVPSDSPDFGKPSREQAPDAVEIEVLRSGFRGAPEAVRDFVRCAGLAELLFDDDA